MPPLVSILPAWESPARFAPKISPVSCFAPSRAAMGCILEVAAPTFPITGTPPGGRARRQYISGQYDNQCIWAVVAYNQGIMPGHFFVSPVGESTLNGGGMTRSQRQPREHYVKTLRVGAFRASTLVLEIS